MILISEFIFSFISYGIGIAFIVDSRGNVNHFDWIDLLYILNIMCYFLFRNFYLQRVIYNDIYKIICGNFKDL